MKYSFLVLTLSLLSLVAAQNIPQVGDYLLLNSTEDIVKLISEADNEVLLVTASLKDKIIAETLHSSITERGLEVFILSPQKNIEQRANYVQSLALAGAIVRFSAIGNDFFIIDREHVVAHNEAEAYYFNSDIHGRYFASVFREAFLAGEIYEPLNSFEGEEE